MISEQATPLLTQERFLILAREPSPITRRFEAIFSLHGQVEVIVDSEPSSGDSSIWYPDEEVIGYHGLLDTFFPKSTCTSWGRAMFHLSKTMKPHEAVWFIEDDVAGNAAFFSELIEETIAFDADLSSIGISKITTNLQPHNELAKPWFDEPWQAFLPMCRMSFRMIDAALEFRKTHGQFAFLEVMFSSLMNQQGMRHLDWSTQLGFLRFFSKFHYRPAIEEIKLGICHAVKDAAILEAICVLEGKPGPEPAIVLAEGRKLMATYSGDRTGKWFDGDHYYRWKMWFAVEQPIKMLEIGAGDGMGVNLILDAIFTHEKSEVHCIENFDEQESMLEIFNENAKRGQYETRLPLYEGATAEILAWMITEEDYWESFDFIHQTQNKTAAELLANACQSWPLLKMHGAMAFSNLTDPKVKAAMNAWIAAYIDQLEVMWTPDEERLIVTKKPPYEKAAGSSGPFGAMGAENLGGRGNDEGAAEGVSPLEA